MKPRRRPIAGVPLCAALAALVCTATPATADINGNNWQAIGPAPIEGFFPGGTSGRASAVATGPENPQHVYLGTASGGLWFSGDAAQSWVPLTDKQPALAIGAIAVTDCTIDGCGTIYAGTGENAIRRDTYYGRGLLVGTLVSPPASYSWSFITGGGAVDFTHGSINDIIVAPPPLGGVDPRLFVTLSSGVTASASESTVTAPEPALGGYGLYLSNDLGSSWSKLIVLDAGTAKPTDIEFVSGGGLFFPDLLYAGFLGAGLFRTEDDGVTWCPLNAGYTVPEGCPAPGLPDPGLTPFDHVEVAIDPGNAQILYVSLGHCTSKILGWCEPSVYRSDDGGDSWTLKHAGTEQPIADPLNLLSYSRYTHLLAVDNRGWVYLGGLRLFYSPDDGDTFLPWDRNESPGGPTYTFSATNIGKILHLDQHELALERPSPADRMYVTNDGGIYYGTNSGWLSRNRGGLQITGFHGIAASALTPAVLGGTQDNSAVLWWGGSKSWKRMNCYDCGDSGFTVMQATNKRGMFVSAIGFGMVDRSIDGGTSWCGNISGINTGDPKAFYSPLVQGPFPSYHIYYASNRLYRAVLGPQADVVCNDYSWVEVSPVLSSVEISGQVAETDVIQAVDVAPSAPNRIYVGYHSGAIWYTDNATTSLNDWHDIGTGLPDLPITSIAIDRDDLATVLVTLAGFDAATANVWKTTNSGQDWLPSAAALPAGVPVNTAQYEPGAIGDVVWLGMDGNPATATVWKSPDGGATWNAFSSKLPNAPVYRFAFDPSRNRAYAATHGRGAFMIGAEYMLSFALARGDKVWELLGTGQLFDADQTCTIQVKRPDGTVCASGTEDAMGGTVRTDGEGRLVTDRTDFWAGSPLVWGCFDGTCVNDVPVDSCVSDAEPMPDLAVTCGALTADSTTPDLGIVQAPESTTLALELAANAGGGGAASSSFTLTAALRTNGGGPLSLCSVEVGVDPGATHDALLADAETSINDSADCQAAGVSAALLLNTMEEDVEDDFSFGPLLHLLAPTLSGDELVTAIHAAPGAADDLCFSVDELGSDVMSLFRVIDLKLIAGLAGPEGGSVTLVEHSPLGVCEVSEPTLGGETPAEVATTLAAAFQTPGIPGPEPEFCPAAGNPRDARAVGDTLRFSIARKLEICIVDPGIGFSLRPIDLPNVHPVAVAFAPPTECTGPAGASVVLDGSASSDADSTPGTSDDIVLYEWLENLGQADETLLGSDPQIVVPLSLGSHSITLRVTDGSGLISLDPITVEVVDTTPPSVTADGAPDTLWPPNHRLVDVTGLVGADDLCSVPTLRLAAAASDEPANAPGTDDGDTNDDVLDAQIGTPDFNVLLRAERDRTGGGRTYSLIYEAVDGSGNVTPETAEISVPPDIAGVVEPIDLRLTETAPGTLVEWTTVAGATHNVIRGLLGNIAVAADVYDFGAVTCIEAASADGDTVGDEDAAIPSPGEAFFYLVDYDDGERRGYGTETAARPRLPASGDCP